MQITINGKHHDIAANTSIAAVMKQRGFKPGMAVAELNYEIIPNEEWHTTILKEGDVLEIVAFMGGGAYHA